MYSGKKIFLGGNFDWFALHTVDHTNIFCILCQSYKYDYFYGCNKIELDLQNFKYVHRLKVVISKFPPCSPLTHFIKSTDDHLNFVLD